MFAKGFIVLLCVLVVISDGARLPKCKNQPKKCPEKHRPLCGTNGKTYASECALCAAIRETKTKILIQKEGHC